LKQIYIKKYLSKMLKNIYGNLKKYNLTLKQWGLYFKRTGPLSPEMGIAKWENCGNGEIPNPQPSISLTTNEGSETND
jgi:hypothetical protein